MRLKKVKLWLLEIPNTYWKSYSRRVNFVTKISITQQCRSRIKKLKGSEKVLKRSKSITIARSIKRKYFIASLLYGTPCIAATNFKMCKSLR